MTKHGKNSTANPVYSSRERVRDSKESGFGTISKRLCCESVRPLNYCCLTNQPCRHPVLTPQGYIYDKESVINYILKQKSDFKSKTSTVEKNLENKKIKKEQDEIKKKEDEFDKFIKTESFSSKFKSVGKSTKSQSVALHGDSSKKKLACYWLPSLAPSAEEEEVKLPPNIVVCPFSGQPLKLNNLRDVKFSTSKNNDKEFICAITGDVITNSTPCVVLTTTGNVVTKQSVNELIKKPGETYMKCPFSGKQLKEADIIEIKFGGSGFAANGEPVMAKVVTPAMLIS